MPDNKEQNSAESTPEEELEQARARIAELEDLLAQRDKELASSDSRISELEQLVVDRDDQIAALKQSVAESEQKLTDLNNVLTQTISSYRALVIRLNPGVPEELITGDTIEEIDESLANAQTLIDRVRQELEVEIAAAKVPAGAPQRTPVDLSALSPREKIQYAIGGFSSRSI